MIAAIMRLHLLPIRTSPNCLLGIRREPSVPKDAPDVNIAAHTFTFRELATATENFRPECHIGEGGFEHVYKGHLENGQIAGNFLENPRDKYVKVGGIPDVAPDNDTFEIISGSTAISLRMLMILSGSVLGCLLDGYISRTGGIGLMNVQARKTNFFR